MDTPDDTDHTTSPSMRYIVPSLILALAGLLIASAVIWLNHSAQQQQQSEMLMATWGSAYSAAVNQHLAFIQTDTQSTANNPRLAETLQIANPSAKRNVERSLAQRSNAVDAFLNPTGQTAQDYTRDAPINFAALDLLKRAQQGTQPWPEALLVEQRWLLYSAAKLHGSETSGSLLLTYDLASLLSDLPVLTNSPLHIALQQQFANAPTQTLYSSGLQPSDAITQSFSTQHPNWTLVISAPIQPQLSAAQQTALFIAFLAAALCFLVALYLMHISVQRQLKADSLVLCKAVQDWGQGRSIKPYTLNFIALKHIISTLTQKAQAPRSELARKAKATAQHGSIADSASPKDTNGSIDDAFFSNNGF